MIKGILLGTSIAVLITSLLLIITGSTGVLQENLATGAVIGTTGVVSYATITLALSIVTTFFLITILKKPKRPQPKSPENPSTIVSIY